MILIDPVSKRWIFKFNFFTIILRVCRFGIGRWLGNSSYLDDCSPGFTSQ